MDKEKDQLVAEGTVASTLAQWVKPVVTRIEAGSAETGNVANPDAVNS